MDRPRDPLAERRASTDASLGAERASADASSVPTSARAQRVMDDLLERDRILADARLLRFRESADSLLALERSASEPTEGAALERLVADGGRKAERDAADALLDSERRRADALEESRREARETGRDELVSTRKDTDEQLASERRDVDIGVATLEETEHALHQARDRHLHGVDVFGMVTHDLRSPLSIIALNAHFIDHETKEPETREAAKEMTRAAARMARLLTDLLDAARIESGTFRIVRRPEDVGALLSEVLTSYRPLFAARDIRFTVEVPDVPVVASFDHDRIIQVLSNLLGNAMKFTPATGSVALRADVHEHEVALVLRDDGPGIDEAALPHVFERFWQIDAHTRRGLGLGLYICENIVRAHGGRISVESVLGEGATFTFTLPS